MQYASEVKVSQKCCPFPVRGLSICTTTAHSSCCPENSFFSHNWRNCSIILSKDSARYLSNQLSENTGDSYEELQDYHERTRYYRICCFMLSGFNPQFHHCRQKQPAFIYDVPIFPGKPFNLYPFVYSCAGPQQLAALYWEYGIYSASRPYVRGKVRRQEYDTCDSYCSPGNRSCEFHLFQKRSSLWG